MGFCRDGGRFADGAGLGPHKHSAVALGRYNGMGDRHLPKLHALGQPIEPLAPTSLA